jgi:3-oxoacyl-(acyl-carrier-protein) synthase
VVELIASTLALGEGRLFRTLNYETSDPECALAVTRQDDQPTGNSFLKLGVTPQAQAAAIVVARCDA